MQGFAENDEKFKKGVSKAFEFISDMHGNWSCLQRNVLINSTSDTVQRHALVSTLFFYSEKLKVFFTSFKYN